MVPLPNSTQAVSWNRHNSEHTLHVEASILSLAHNIGKHTVKNQGETSTFIVHVRGKDLKSSKSDSVKMNSNKKAVPIIVLRRPQSFILSTG